MTLANDQCYRGMLSSRNKARSFCFSLRWTFFHFFRICNVGKYSLMKYLENIFASAFTAFQWVLLVTWPSLIVSGLKHKGYLPKIKYFGFNTWKSFISQDNCVSRRPFNVASVSAEKCHQCFIGHSLSFAIFIKHLLVIFTWNPRILPSKDFMVD